MGKTDDWMPLILAPWRRGTTFLSPTERGIYLELLLVCWEHGSLPNEDDVLQGLARCKEKDWRAARVKVLAKFYERDGMLYSERNEIEKQKANQFYSKKASAGKAGGVASGQARAKQTGSKNEADTTCLLQANGQANGQAEPQAKTNTTYLEHTPSGVNHPSDDLAKRPRASKGTRLENDWQPNAADRAYGADRGLTDPEIDAEANEFRAYFHGADAAKPVKRDWPAAWQRWIRGNAAKRISQRQRPKGHAYDRPSPVAARNRILAKAGVRAEEIGAGGDSFVRAEAAGGASSDCASDTNSGAILDADEWQRVPGPVDGTEGHDPAFTGHDGRSGSPINGVPETLHGLPSGRGEARPENPARDVVMVAGLGRTEGAVGAAQLSTPYDASVLEIPALLRRA